MGNECTGFSATHNGAAPTFYGVTFAKALM